jgi:HEAT repeat protein
MLSDRKRLFLLIGLAAVLAVVYVAVRGVPGQRESRSAGGGDSANLPPSGRENVPERAKVPEQAEVAARRREVVDIAVQSKPEYLPQLKKAAADPDWRVRHAAVDGVGRLGREGDPQFLIDVLRNPNEQAEVRAAAAERLGEMRHWDAGPAIIDAMEDSSDLLRARAGVALRRIIVVDLGYRANDSSDRRGEVIRRIRQLWPWFYERFTKLEKAKG